MRSDRKEELFGKYCQPLLRFIQKLVDNKEDAQDILQETLISANYSLPTFSGKSSFATWLYGIARHEVADFYRKKKIKEILFSRLPFLEGLASQALGPEEELVEKEIKEKTKKILLSLSEGYRVILRLKYVEGRPVGQIARELGMTFKAAESRLSRARLAFKIAWKITENAKGQRKIKSFRFPRDSFGCS